MTSCGPQPDRPNILLVSIDSLRADHADGVDGRLPTGPNLHRLVTEGAVFSHAISAAPWTTPSMMSVLTGLFPISHHVRDHNFSLSPEVPVLSERLKKLGYATAAIVPSATLREDFGFPRGFDFYSNGRYGHNILTSAPMAGQALAWLEKNAPGGSIAKPPFFLWIHFWDPHYNYIPPSPFSTKFPSAYHPPDGTRYDLTELKNHESPLRPEECDYLKSQYDGELLYVDGFFGDMLDFLASRGIVDNTIVIVLGDHGEAFQEHGWLTHTMRVEDEMVRVPLIVRWPGHVPAGRRIDTAVSLVDVTPTILDLVGSPIDEDAIEGRSLRGAIEGSSIPEAQALGGSPSRPIVSETIRQASLAGWREGEWKYILNMDTCAGSLFNIARDPGETVDLAASEPAEAGKLRAGLLAFYAHRPIGERIPVVRMDEVSNEDRKLLQSLGYIGGNAPSSGGAAKFDSFGDVETYSGFTDPGHCH